MQRSKIYTRRGDDGSTALIGSERVSKADPRIEAYGTVDELNSFLGLAGAFIDRSAPAEIAEILSSVQADLFTIGAVLACPDDDQRYANAITKQHVDRLEQWIDRMDADMPPLKTFILPGGTPLAALLHVARSVCRRAERHVAELAKSATVPQAVLAYLNRLSDLLFVLARYANHAAGRSEHEWPGIER